MPEDKDLILVSTGTGLAPYLSMIRTAHRCGQGRIYTVVHGARHAWDLGYRPELEALDHGCGTFHYLPTVTQPDAAWSGHAGRVQSVFEDGRLAAVLGTPLSPDRHHVFLCGSPAMLEDMQARLEGAGWVLHRPREPGNLHIEKYW